MSPVRIYDELHKRAHESVPPAMRDVCDAVLNYAAIFKPDTAVLEDVDAALQDVLLMVRRMRQDLNELRPTHPHGYLCPEKLTLECQHQEGPDLGAEVSVNRHGIFVRFDGYGCATDDDGECVLIEQLNGVPRVIVWSDINEEDPTHLIELDAAAQTARED